MIFSSTFFLCIFLPITLILYYIVPWKFKNALLLLASLIFYAWGEPIYVFLMMFSIVFNYIAGLQLGEFDKSMLRLTGSGRNSDSEGNTFEQHGKNALRHSEKASYNRDLGQYDFENGSSSKAKKRVADILKKKKSVFVFTVVVNIAILCFFKYYGFLLTNINSIFGTSIPVKELALPIGISFYTFQILSYIIDVYWGKVAVQKNIIDFGAYIAMFPQLIAGPIVRYEDIANQLKSRTITLAKVADGAAWFIRGLAKKVLLANNIGLLFDTIYAIPAADRPVLTSWIGIIAYTFQIYFDFSGYSDMAVGLGKMMGFQFVQNFNYPYISKSATEFWRRWHISLGTWFREYVYIPLGGNRVSMGKHIRNILVVWLLTGLWHGADWCFIIWGVYYGLILILEKFVLKNILERIPGFISHIYTIFIFVIGWLIFTAPSLTDLGLNLSALFGGQGNVFADSATWYYITTNLILLIVCGFCSTPAVWKVFSKVAFGRNKAGQIAAIICYALIFTCSIAYLVNSTYNPFLYFKF